MGKIVEKKMKRKKKGRPSLLDLQKRSLKEEQEEQQKQMQNLLTPTSSDNYKTVSASSLLRSSRRNPTYEVQEYGEESEGASRKEKKLRLVLKLPAQRSPDDSAALPNYPVSDSEDRDSASGRPKRKINSINSIGGGSGAEESQKGDPSAPVPDNADGNQLDLGPSTPLPDKKLLLFILDSLQKKDTYDVFAEPVDPEELPDYHEIIKHPMDFRTIRKKLDAGAYANLERFEKDVFLLCSNAKQYNAPDTIYFRQARSIEEMAKKNFDNLRQDSDDDEPEPKAARRGRPPMKNIIRKMMGKHSTERVASDLSSGTTLTKAAENNHKGNLSSEKSRISDLSGLHGAHQNVYMSWLSENKFERSDEGSMLLKNSHFAKNGKKQFVVDENRRNTYEKFHTSTMARGPSVLATFRTEKKQLLPVGLHTEHGYARSLSRFAANLGPVTWTVGSIRIGKCLPAGVKFGPGWVGEDDVTPQRPLLTSECSAQPLNLCSPETSLPATSSSDKSSEEPETASPEEKFVPSSDAVKPETTLGLNSHSGFDVASSNSSFIRPRPQFQIHSGMNGFNRTYEFNHPAQIVKLKENKAKSDNSGTAMSSPSKLANSMSMQRADEYSRLPQRTEPNSDSTDLNVWFQSPGSPSSCRVDSTQPDLALHLG